MTLLVIGEFFSDNLGDPLLCEVVYNALQSEFEGSKIIPFDLSGKISMTEKYSYVEKKSRFKIINKIRRRLLKINAIKKAYKKKNQYWYIDRQLDEILKREKIDLAVFAGGEMFMDFFANKIYHTVKSLKNTKIIFHACGVYSISNESKKIFEKAIYKKNVKSISLRDSYERFKNSFPKSNPIKTFDTALACSKFYEPSANKTHEYGIGVIARDDSYWFQKELLQNFLKSDYDWQLFTNGASYDYEFAEKLLEDIGITADKITDYLHERPHTAGELVKQVTEYEKIISFRMHSQIVAVSFGIPSFGFVWDNKVKEFYDNLGLKQNYASPEGEASKAIDLDSLSIDNNELAEKSRELGEKSCQDLIMCAKNALKL